MSPVDRAQELRLWGAMWTSGKEVNSAEPPETLCRGQLSRRGLVPTPRPICCGTPTIDLPSTIKCASDPDRGLIQDFLVSLNLARHRVKSIDRNMQTTYDYIICGGGASGCIVAARLTEDPSLKVLVLERGKTNKGDVCSETPAMYLANLANGNTHHHTSEPSEDNDNKRVPVPVGNILGGGSSVNFLMYTRPSHSDFEWDMPNWHFKDVLPFFKKMETFHGKNDSQTKDVHGYDGPIQVSPGHVNTAVLDSFEIATRKVLGKSYRAVEDSNDFTSVGHQKTGWNKWM